MFVKIDSNETVVKFPYDIGTLKREYPNVSFPNVKNMNDNILQRYNIHTISLGTKPTVDNKIKKISAKNAPTKQKDGSWVLEWDVLDKTVEETDQFVGMYKAKVEKEADKRVSAVSGDSTDKLIALMDAVDLLDKRDNRPLTDSENATMTGLRSVKDAVTQIRIAEATIKASINDMTGSEIEALDIPNHPEWP